MISGIWADKISGTDNYRIDAATVYRLGGRDGPRYRTLTRGHGTTRQEDSSNTDSETS